MCVHVHVHVHVPVHVHVHMHVPVHVHVHLGAQRVLRIVSGSHARPNCGDEEGLAHPRLCPRPPSCAELQQRARRRRRDADHLLQAHEARVGKVVPCTP